MLSSSIAGSILALAAGAAIGGAGAGEAPAEPRSVPQGPGRNLNLILSTATRGELLPCGVCRVAAGGLPRRAGLIEACRDTSGFVLAGEGGDVFRPGGADPQVDGFLIKMLDRIGYSAMGVGEEDLARGGPKYLKELVADYPGLEWVSANIVDAKSGKPVFAPYATRRVGSVVVGFTSCLEPALWQEHAARHPEVRIEPPLITLARLMPEMRAHCQLIVGFIHMDVIPLRELLSELEGIDIAVASHGPRIKNWPTRMGTTRQLFFAGRRGRYVNWSNVELSPGKATPYMGRSIYMRELVPEDSTITREIMAFLGTREPSQEEPEDADEPAAEGEPGAGANHN